MRFRIIVLTLFGALFAYFLVGLVLPFQEPVIRGLGGGVLAGIFGAILWVPLVFWQKESEETTRLQRGILWIAFCGLAVLSFALVLLLTRDLASLVGLGAVAGLRTERASEVIVSVSLALFFLGHYRAQYDVKLRQIVVPIADLPRELSGLKILQITDLHVGPTIRRPFVEKMVRLANSAAPDLIVLTGDLADGSVSDLVDEVAPLSELRAPLGCYYVPGNHEYYWAGPAWIEKARSLGFIPLLNSNVILRKDGKAFAIAGIVDPAAKQAGQPGPDFDRAFAGIPGDAFPKIFLAHQPQAAVEAEKRGATLQLSGHTHGGQFFPWTLVASWVHRFNVGLHRLDSMWVYVSRGTGYWGPPVRFGSPAELTLLVLSQAPRA